MGNFSDKVEIRTNWGRVKRPFETYGLTETHNRRLRPWFLIILLLISLSAGIWNEIHTSFFQARFLSQYAEKLSYWVEPGQSQDIIFPKNGPFNKRHGYDRIPEFQSRLKVKSYHVTEQARFSPELLKTSKQGVTPPFQEKPAVGLVIRDSEGQVIYDTIAKRQVFDQFDHIPPLMVKSLLFIEDREMDNPVLPFRNPVINWNRLVMAGILYGASKLRLPVHVEGGSTLATQLEKYRYSPNGNTYSVFDKLRQMTAATLRVYKEGPDTRAVRHQIVLDYINTAPLAAVPGHGEIYGMGEGFYSWFGMDVPEVRQAFILPDTDPGKARVFKQALCLVCAVRAPSYYLIYDHDALENRVSGYVNLLEKEGLINTDFASRVREAPVVFAPGEYVSVSVSSAMRKAINAVRTSLTRNLDVPGYYDLDRMDLEVETTINSTLQKEVSELFEKLKDPDFIKENGLKAHRLLASGDPDKVIYSFLLFESTPYGNALRVRADNLKQPFDLNGGMKLILGSTAKLRTLAHYLEIIALVYREFSDLDRKGLKKAYAKARDPITRWVARAMRQNRDLSLEELLQRSLKRTYSASAKETFFTGGGIHTFQNFRAADNHRIITVKEATIRSVNLVFIRLIRDLVRYHRVRLPYDADKVLADSKNPDRRRLLEEIADDEAKLHLSRFYKAYKKLSPDKILKRLLKHRVTSARHLGIVFFAWHPGAGAEEFSRWLEDRGINVSPVKARYLTNIYSKPHLTLSDYGYLLKKHPLELWCAGEFIRSPGISWKKLLPKSVDARRICSAWLLKPKMRRPQDLRLRTRIEKDAFVNITSSWRNLGFPFKKLVPSYSTSIGSSCDQPAALAELIGIIVNDGIRRPAVSIQKIRMASGTPYHTVFDISRPSGNQVMEPAVARTLCAVLQAVVEEGTARRVKGAFTKTDKTPIRVGGKTGTGDNRSKKFSRSGDMISSKAVNRTATFAFYIGDRYFGVITAFVSGTEANDYNFTSGLPVSILKLLAPALGEHLDSPEKPGFLPVPPTFVETRSPVKRLSGVTNLQNRPAT
ncbi:transglycosylase domain-containing protein [Desulfonema magnum]|uniref:peptidoglycan glycosyltransferase n=1 Tax=Desulfonema magnum TaxID=45655 RepID=A0A975GPK3_9BACT|nr:transglycosylase domain-containing protein [Desulfonema magnum]QTA88003.1 Transglycosylase family protein [Desulfonema magnum]